MRGKHRIGWRACLRPISSDAGREGPLPYRRGCLFLDHEGRGALEVHRGRDGSALAGLRVRVPVGHEVQVVVRFTRTLTIADQTDAAVVLTHHIRKSNGEDATIDSVRGAAKP